MSPIRIDPTRRKREMSTSSPEDARRRPPPRVHVLLVDDNRMHRVLTGALLEDRGYTITTAGDGAEAVERFRKGHFDFVLMDLQMPGVDGYEATRRIREVESDRRRRVPIIALTSHSGAADRKRCLEAGMDEHVVKPIGPEDLDGAIVARFLNDPADFEMTAALERASGDPEVLRAIVRSFVDRAPDRMRAIYEALDRRDGSALRESAHSLEGVAHELAMPRLRDLAHEVAALGQRGELDEAASLAEALEAALGRSAAAATRSLDSA